MLNVAKTYVINLPRKPERLVGFLMRKPFDNPIEVIDGVDGNDLLADPRFNPSFFMPNLEFSEMKGCSMSHLLVYQDIIQNEFPTALICEDDVDFHPGFVQKTNELLKLKDFDILRLGCGEGYCCHLPHGAEIGLGNRDALVSHEYKVAFGTHAYVITPYAAKYILLSASACPIWCPIDIYISVISSLGTLRQKLAPALCRQIYYATPSASS